VLKTQPGYEGKESGKENRNQEISGGNLVGCGYTEIPLFRYTFS